jgi:hypothetical protein
MKLGGGNGALGIFLGFFGFFWVFLGFFGFFLMMRNFKKWLFR